MGDVHFCHGHAALAEAQKKVPRTPDGQPIPGFLPYLRPARDSDFDDTPDTD